MSNQPQHNNDRGQKWSGLDQIKLTPGELFSDLFSRVAEEAANLIYDCGRGPQPSQHRKFYDEICLWDNKCQNQEDLEQHLPFILMLKAKVAYAKGRKHVNDQYKSLINHCLGELEKKPELETLRNLKLFMEAFTGFYYHKQKNQEG